ncbi:MAG: ATP-binding protein [Gammaproteobacteria bacterium]|nr:ATP-binding protein [Gammaproteobacteria bacterium]
MCSPKVRGSKSVSFGFNALRRTGRYGKKATRLCPCGYLGHPHGQCHCTVEQVQRYRGRLSGPLLDRIDMHVEVPALSGGLYTGGGGETSAAVRDRVLRARNLQWQRSRLVNSQLPPREIRQHCALADKEQMTLEHACDSLGLSARAHQRILKLARTIADLEGSAAIQKHHLLEAISYRRLDRRPRHMLAGQQA